MKDAAEVIVLLRKEQKLTQAGMAEMLGVSESYLAKIEIGERKPSRAFLFKLKREFPLCDMNIFFAK